SDDRLLEILFRKSHRAKHRAGTGAAWAIIDDGGVFSGMIRGGAHERNSPEQTRAPPDPQVCFRCLPCQWSPQIQVACHRAGFITRRDFPCMAFNLKKVLKALLLSSSQPLSIKDIQAAFTRFHEQATALPLETSPGGEPEAMASANPGETPS